MERNNEKGTKEDLCRYRLEISKADLRSAMLLLEAGELRGANNRAYYSIYHAISSVHALDGNAYKRHKDALANFNKAYVKTEIFSRELGRKISEAVEYGMQVIMMIFISQREKKQKSRLRQLRSCCVK